MSLSVLTRGGSSGPAASIFVTGLSETDIVTATNGIKTVHGKWWQKENTAYIGLPDGYTQLECIESTGTQWINMNLIAKTNYRAEIAFKATEVPTSGSSRILGAYTTNNGWRAGFSDGKFFTDDGFSYSQTADKYAYTIAYGTCKSNQTVGTALFGQMESGGIAPQHVLNAKYELYYCKIWDANGVLIRYCVPAKRNNDGVFGLYDIANDTFYTNAGSGEFVPGAEIHSTVGGHIIAPIKDPGMWTVTATNGEQTATQDVLVDVITEYEIEMDLYKTWLYRKGDEFEEVTGGWSDSGYTIALEGWFTSGNVVKNDDSILLTATYATQTGKAVPFKCIGTSNTVDLSKYGTLYAHYSLEGADYIHSVDVSEIAPEQYVVFDIYGNTTTKILYVSTFTTTSKTNTRAFLTASASNTFEGGFNSSKSATIHEIWLE